MGYITITVICVNIEYYLNGNLLLNVSAWAVGPIKGEAEYWEKYNLFGEIRVSAVQAMEKAKFSKRNIAKIERLGAIECSGPGEPHIMAMCIKFMNLIDEILKDEE